MNFQSLLAHWGYIQLCLATVITAVGSYLFLKFKLKSKGLPAFTCMLLILIIFSSYFYYRSTEANTESYYQGLLKGYAPAYATAFKNLGLHRINAGTKPDDPLYLTLIQTEMEWLRENSMISDIYTFGKNNEGATVLLVDSETDYDRNGVFEGDREVRTVIGEIYDEDAKTIDSAFSGVPLLQMTPVSDRWGVWISAYQPIKNESGKVYAVIGVDFPAEVYLDALNTSRREVFTISFGFVLIVLFFSLIFRIVSTQAIKDLEFEKELQRSRARTQESSRLASLGEMSAGIAHEINNPLAIIKGKASQLSRAIASGSFEASKLTADLEKISTTTDRIAKIVKGLRTFARHAENDPFLETSLSSIVEDVLSLCGEKIRYSGVDLKINIPEGLTLKCRSTEIAQVLLNLLSNALDATAELPEKWVLMEAQEVEDGFIDVRITDSGDGIPLSVAEKIMVPFFTTKEVGKGTGLGLSISFGIAKNHGGELILDRNSSKTCFILRLPKVGGVRLEKKAG